MVGNYLRTGVLLKTRVHTKTVVLSYLSKVISNLYRYTLLFVEDFDIPSMWGIERAGSAVYEVYG